MTAEQIAGLEAALKEWGGQWESEVYEGAYHSWTTDDSPVYNEGAAERAFEQLVDLMDQTLR
jgi:dienelactone hydrolase